MSDDRLAPQKATVSRSRMDSILEWLIILCFAIATVGVGILWMELLLPALLGRPTHLQLQAQYDACILAHKRIGEVVADALRATNHTRLF